MAWEFRKLGPGENVAVETQRDPFAAPKWAPPVWHMPEGLVLLVNAVRVLVRAVVFLVRNIVPVSAVAVAGLARLRLRLDRPRPGPGPRRRRPGRVGGGGPSVLRPLGRSSGPVPVAAGVGVPARTGNPSWSQRA